MDDAVETSAEGAVPGSFNEYITLNSFAPEIQALMTRLSRDIDAGRITPYQAAARILEEYFR